jgi:phytanoyl-CoA dioxygenase PhyH
MGELQDNSSLLGHTDALQSTLQSQGYLYLRGALDRDAVLAARREVFSRLIEVGEAAPPPEEGISTGTSKRAEIIEDLGAFWKSVCEGEALRRVTHDGAMVSTLESILGGPVRPFDFLWLRPMHPGKASAFHFDHVYMNRGSEQLLTCWTPLGDVPLIEGPILLVENSHTWDDLIDQYRGFDVDKETERPGHVTLDPVSFAQDRGTRLLTTNFEAGDLLVLVMFMLHGSLDNQSPDNRIRLSSDVRYQPAADPIDERWVGENPIAHGLGYGSMGGSRPATSKVIRR